jgi:hypothetical protein
MVIVSGIKSDSPEMSGVVPPYFVNANGAENPPWNGLALAPLGSGLAPSALVRASALRAS